jgi:hypothetical protein
MRWARLISRGEMFMADKRIHVARADLIGLDAEHVDFADFEQSPLRRSQERHGHHNIGWLLQ